MQPSEQRHSIVSAANADQMIEYWFGGFASVIASRVVGISQFQDSMRRSIRAYFLSAISSVGENESSALHTLKSDFIS